MVDGMADYCLLRCRAGGRWPFQTRLVLQICLPDRPIQLCGLDNFPAWKSRSAISKFARVARRRTASADSGSLVRLGHLQRGCELALFQPRKVGNMDCTFCLDCVHACPHDNVGILSRLPASELMVDPMRSGIGYFSRRKDMAALALVFTFGALLNAFGMVSPVYAVEQWLAKLLHVTHEAPVLAAIFAFFLIVEPIVLVGWRRG